MIRKRPTNFDLFSAYYSQASCPPLAVNPHNSLADHLCTGRASIDTSMRCYPNSRGRVCALFLNYGFGFDASDAFSMELKDICPERSLRQAGLQNLDRVLAILTAHNMSAISRLPNGSLARCGAQQPDQPSENGSSRPRPGHSRLPRQASGSYKSCQPGRSILVSGKVPSVRSCRAGLRYPKAVFGVALIP
jgi:hypothetical protein